MNKSLKIVFAGTPDFAARHLEALIASDHDIVGVYTQPDRPAGRGKKLHASAVKQLATEKGIEVFQPQNFKSQEAKDALANLTPDIMIVVAYGLILPQAVLDIPKLGCLNVHGSLLPRWRGAAPIQRAIWAGDNTTGVTIMQMDKGLDTGDMLLKQSLKIEADDTSASLYEKLAKSGPQALISCLAQLNDIAPEKQDDTQVTYAEKLSKQEALIDWNIDAEQLERNVRAFNPWPVSHFSINVEGTAIAVKIWESEVTRVSNTDEPLPGTVISANKRGILVKCKNHGLLIKTLQIPGKKPMSAADILNARKEWFCEGRQLG